MAPNAYQPPNETPNASEPASFLGFLWIAAVVGSVVLILCGGAVIALGMAAADGRDFFFLVGAHVLASGILGLPAAWMTSQSSLARAVRWMASIVNAALLVRLVTLVTGGVVFGSLALAMPAIIGVPAALNFFAASYRLRGGESVSTAETP